jgi:Mg2+ and Co2+ transporter CorA
MSWTHLTEPSPDELAAFVREVGLLPGDGEFITQKHHRSDVIVRDKYMIILIHVPIFIKRLRVTRGVPLYLVVLENSLWSLCYEQIVVLVQLWDEFENSAEMREEYFNDGSLLLALQVISRIHNSSLRKLERLAKHIDIAEDAVFQGNERKMVEEIAYLTRDIMDFRKVTRLQNNLFAKPPQHQLMSSRAVDQWRRVHGQIQRLWDVLEGLFESTKQLGSTNRGLLQHKENELLRFLTYYSIVSIPILLLLEPLYMRIGNDTIADTVYLIGLGILVIALLTIFIRFRGKRIL